jgi:glycolate oxidase iron-sulfur subunit
VVGLLTGCVQSAFFSPVSAATARVLAREGCDVLIPRGQGCCGALPLHAGRREQARRLARRTIAGFARAGVDVVVTDVAGCGSAMKEYERLLADDPHWAGPAARFAARTRDVSEFLIELGPRAPYRELPLTVAYHDACHLAYGQGITSAPRELLGLIPSLRVVDVPDGGTCCGSAGVYNLLQPGPATELGDRKAAAIMSVRADLVAAGNPGCLLQITSALDRAGTPLPARHTIELLDAALRPST